MFETSIRQILILTAGMFVILTDDLNYMSSEEHLEDLADILIKCILMSVQDGEIIEEIAMEKEIFVFLQSERSDYRNSFLTYEVGMSFLNLKIGIK
jgi:hypothetical protein